MSTPPDENSATPAEEQRPVRILQLSDTHLLGGGRWHRDQVDTTAALERVLSHAASLAHVDAIVATGDLSDDGSVESYRTLRRMLEAVAAQWDCPVLATTGNHDDRPVFETVFGPADGVTDVRGLRIVRLSTTVAGRGYGALSGAQLDSLAEQLREPSRRGSMLALHHPPVPARTALLAALELLEPQSLWDRVTGTDLHTVVAGHFHHALVTTVGQVTVAVAPAVANSTDVTAPSDRERAVRGSGYAVIDIAANGIATVLPVRVPAPDDGVELFDLSPAEVARLADEYGLLGAQAALGAQAGPGAQAELGAQAGPAAGPSQ